MAGKPAESWDTWPAIVRYDGVFDFDGMYKAIVEFMRRHNYWFYETLYKHKPWSPIGTELTLKWRGERKLDEYYMYIIEFEWHFMDFHQVEVIREGKKVTLTKAYFWVIMKGTLNLDWQNYEAGEGGKGKAKLFGTFFRKHVVNREALYDYLYPLHGELMELQAIIQQWTNMEASRTEKLG